LEDKIKSVFCKLLKCIKQIQKKNSYEHAFENEDEESKNDNFFIRSRKVYAPCKIEDASQEHGIF
jgi:hypothetical protein